MMAFRTKRFALTASVLAMTLAAGTAQAQSSAADRETARSMMQEGRDLRDKGDLKGALQRFKAADDIMHVPTTGLEVARTQVSLGLLVEARDTVATIHKTPAQPDDPAPFKDARVKADELDAQIESRIPTLTISVIGAAETDTPVVMVDGVSLPPSVASLPRKIDPGHHVVSAKAASGEAKQELDIAEGDKKEVQLTLVAGTPTGPQEESTAGAAPETEQSVVHTPGPLTWAGIVVGGLGLAVGTVTGILELSKASTVKGECANKQCGPGTPASDLSAANSLATISTVSFAVAAAGAAVAVVSLVVGHGGSTAVKTQPAADPEANPASPEPSPDAPPPAPESRLRVTPFVGPGSAGIFGTF
jgi:hypothetical protein